MFVVGNTCKDIKKSTNNFSYAYVHSVSIRQEHQTFNGLRERPENNNSYQCVAIKCVHKAEVQNTFVHL